MFIIDKNGVNISKVLVSGLFPLNFGPVTPNIHKDTSIGRSREKGCIKIDILMEYPIRDGIVLSHKNLELFFRVDKN